MSSADRSDVPQWPNWLGLVTDDLDGQRRFYRDVLALEETDAGDDWVQFDLGAGRLFELLRRTQDPQYERVRYQPGFAVDDIERARDRLLALGAQPIGEVEGGPGSGGAWCYFRDPEGNVFEISQRIPASGGDEAPE